MKISLQIKLIVFFFTLMPFWSYGQSCIDYHKRTCEGSDNKLFKYNPTSRSAIFIKGESSEFGLDVFRGKDYRISICYDEPLGEILIFKIKDEEDKILYDNRKDGNILVLEFSALETRRLTIYVKVPEDEEGEDEGDSQDLTRKPNLVGCVGVLIEHMNRPKRGF